MMFVFKAKFKKKNGEEMDAKKFKERLENLKTGGKKSGGSQPFWKIPQGESVVRICSMKDGEDPFFERWLHYNVGPSGFLCLKKNYGEKCPICDFAFQLYKEGGDSVQAAKKFFSSQRFYSPVVVRGQESKGILWWSYGKTVYETMMRIGANPDYGDFTDLETGTDLVVSYVTQKGKLFPDTTIQPRRKSSRFCDDLTHEDCQKLVDSMVHIDTLIDKKTADEMQQLLDKMLLSEKEMVEQKELEKYGGKEETKEEVSDIDKAFEDLGL